MFASGWCSWTAASKIYGYIYIGMYAYEEGWLEVCSSGLVQFMDFVVLGLLQCLCAVSILMCEDKLAKLYSVSGLVYN